MKKVLSAILAATVFLTFAACGEGGTSQGSETNSVNVALNKPVYFSTQADAGLMPAKQVNDGDTSTSWSSDTAQKNIDEWIVVDLGENYNVDVVTIRWGASYSTSYAVELSRGGSEFSEIFSTTEGDGEVAAVSGKNAVGRYVRVRCKNVVSVLGTYMGATIQEIEVTGKVAEDQTLGNETETMVITKAVAINKDDVLRGGRSYNFKTLAAAGSTFEYQCTGRAAGATVTGEGGQFEVSIDGGEYKAFEVKKGTHEYIFSKELDDGVHTVRITRQTDSWGPVFTVDNVIIEDGAEIVEGYKGNYDLKIEFVGDSLTSAQGVDYSQSYVVEAARILNAHFQVVSRGGMGVYRNHDDSTYGTLPSYYEYTEYQNPKSDKPYTYNADVVVFNIGGNDAVCQMRFHNTANELALYLKAYKKLYAYMLDEVFTANPNAMVVCCYGQLGSNTPMLEVIPSIVEEYRKDHPERRIEVFEFDMAIDFTVTNDGHPGPKSHKRDGAALAQKIQELLGK